MGLRGTTVSRRAGFFILPSSLLCHDYYWRRWPRHSIEPVVICPNRDKHYTQDATREPDAVRYQELPNISNRVSEMRIRRNLDYAKWRR